MDHASRRLRQAQRACAARQMQDDDAQPARTRLRAAVWEALTVIVFCAEIAGVMYRDQLRAMTRSVPEDLGDPVYYAWQLAWVSHALVHDPAGLFTSNTFLREPGNLVFNDTALGYAPLGLISAVATGGGMAGALMQVNLALVLATAVASVGGYTLARALGASPWAAAVAAAGFGYAPWRLEQDLHVNVLSTGGIALALAFLARGNGWSLRDGWRPARMSPRWIAAGWVTASVQLTYGFATGIWFCYTLMIVMACWTAGWLLRGRRQAALPRGVVVAHLAGGTWFLLACGLLLLPYLRVIRDHPELPRGPEKGLGWLPQFSPPWRGLLTAPGTDLFWGPRQTGWRNSFSWQGEMVDSPGMVLLALAVAGLFVSAWPLRRRLVIAGVTAVLVVLAMGTAFPGGGRWTWMPLFLHAPGWSALRTPGRLIIWVTLGLALLAAGAVQSLGTRLGAWADRLRTRPAMPAVTLPAVTLPALTALTALAAFAAPVLIVAEGAGRIPMRPVPLPPVHLAALSDPILVLPTARNSDYVVMLWSTEGFPVITNGDTGFDPTSQAELRRRAASFPSADSVAYLRSRGVRTVVLDLARAGGTPWEHTADQVPPPGVRRDDVGRAVVYQLGGPGEPTPSAPPPSAWTAAAPAVTVTAPAPSPVHLADPGVSRTG